MLESFQLQPCLLGSREISVFLSRIVAVSNCHVCITIIILGILVSLECSHYRFSVSDMEAACILLLDEVLVKVHTCILIQLKCNIG